MEHLWIDTYNTSDKSKFICYAAFNAKVHHIVVPIITELLDGSYTLEIWLDRNKHVPAYDLFPSKRTKYIEYEMKIQATRKAWLEHLINHYESIGD